MLGYLAKSISQLKDPLLYRTAIAAVLLTISIFGFLNVAIWWMFLITFDLSDVLPWEWLRDLLSWAAGFALSMTMLFVSTILFPGVATIIVGLSLERVASAVEQKHYPYKKLGGQPTSLQTLISTSQFALTVIGLNLLCLPLYLILMFIPPLNLVVYFLLNSYLIGREYFELVAYRYTGQKTVLEMRRKNKGQIFIAGFILTFSLSIPIINFLTPIIATAFMVHVFHGMCGRNNVIKK